MQVYLDGHTFELKPSTGVTRTPLVEWPDNIRLDGQQRQKDRAYLSSWYIDSWKNGLGIQKQNVDLAEHNYRLWDAENVDTRWPNSIILSPAFNTCTLVPSRGDLDLHFNYNNQLYFVETNRRGSQGIFFGGYAYGFSVPNTIGSFSVVATAGVEGSLFQSGNIAAIRSFGQYIVIAPQVGAASFVRVATLGGVPTVTGSTASATVPTFSRIQIGDMGGTVHISLYMSGLPQTRLYIMNQDVNSLVNVASLNMAIGSYLSPLETDGITMYADLPQGFYDFDTAPGKVIDSQRSEDINPIQAMFRNELYFKNKTSLLHYDGAVIDSVGYDLADGLPSDKLGEITGLTSSWKWLFAAVKGATYSHILTMDENHVWQYYTRIPSAGLWVRELFLSSAPDGIDRLWCLFSNYAFPGYFLNPMVNPLQAGTYAFVPTGHFTPPIYDAGMADIQAAFYDTAFSCDAIGSNQITALYGLNGDSPITTLGVVASISQTLKYGSPYGVQAIRIQPKIILSNAGVAGTTPVFNKATIHYLKDPDRRQSFDFTIDLQETSRDAAKPVEAILGTLSSIMNSKVLMPFWYGQVGTKAVKIIDIPAEERVDSGKIMEGERTGFIRLRVAEIV